MKSRNNIINIVKDGPYDEVEEKAAGEVLPGEGGVLHDVQEPAPALAGGGWRQNDLLRLHSSPVLLARFGEDLLGLFHPGLGDEPPWRLREPEEDD